MIRQYLPEPAKRLLRSCYRGSACVARASLRTGLGIFRFCLGRHGFLKLCHWIGRDIDWRIESAGIVFDGSQHIPYLRAVSVLTQEPDIIGWLNDVIKRDDVLYDIGANVGVFSLYSAKRLGARVIAFEPFAGNYVLLNRNIFLNGLSGRITALNIAVHDRTTLSHLNVSEFWPGKAGHSFAEPIGSHGDVFEPKFRQGAIGMSIDDFIERFDPPFPDHLKIDVDGNEALVIAGMEKTLADLRLKTIVVELNLDLPHHAAAADSIVRHGFLRTQRREALSPTSKEASNILNHFFMRPE